MSNRILLIAALAMVVAPVWAADDSQAAAKRPDLSGTYDIATLTPLQRPAKFGDKLTLTDEEAQEIARKEAEYMARRNAATDPNRGAPPEGGDGSAGAAGNVRNPRANAAPTATIHRLVVMFTPVQSDCSSAGRAN